MNPWPPLPFSEWRDTCNTLHMWTQVVGKTQLALTPLMNHWWNVTLLVTPRGLRTATMWYGAVSLQGEFDFAAHRLRFETSEGAAWEIALGARSVADFYAEYMAALHAHGIAIEINTMPDEVADPIRFDQDKTHAAYDKQYVERFRHVLIHADRLLQQFRAKFLGKCSPVHFFWGSFDMAVTRFSGRKAPVKPATGRMMRETYSHEVSSCGWWPGDARFPEAAFYAYAAPPPDGFDKTPVRPGAAFWHQSLGEFLLRYEDVRKSDSADQDVLDFCESTYRAAADLAGWDRALERSAVL